MPKYRLLSESELQELEPEFIKYLILNGIDADEWQKLKTNKPEEANQVVDLFSDVVFEKILRNAAYVRLHKPHTIRIIQCDAKDMNMIAVNTDPDTKSKEAYTGKKIYTTSRELEIFNLLQEGYEICEAKEYNELSKAIRIE